MHQSDAQTGLSVLSSESQQQRSPSRPWLTDIRRFLRYREIEDGSLSRRRHACLKELKAAPTTPERWLCFLSNEESIDATQQFPLATVTFKCLYNWAVRTVPREMYSQSEAYWHLWIGLARHEWSKDPDGARRRFSTMLKVYMLGVTCAQAYCTWAVLESNAGRTAKSLSILQKGFMASAEPISLLQETQLKIETGCETLQLPPLPPTLAGLQYVADPVDVTGSGASTSSTSLSNPSSDGCHTRTGHTLTGSATLSTPSNTVNEQKPLSGKRKAQDEVQHPSGHHYAQDQGSKRRTPPVQLSSEKAAAAVQSASKPGVVSSVHASHAKDTSVTLTQHGVTVTQQEFDNLKSLWKGGRRSAVRVRITPAEAEAGAHPADGPLDSNQPLPDLQQASQTAAMPCDEDQRQLQSKVACQAGLHIEAANNSAADLAPNTRNTHGATEVADMPEHAANSNACVLNSDNPARQSIQAPAVPVLPAMPATIGQSVQRIQPIQPPPMFDGRPSQPPGAAAACKPMQPEQPGSAAVAVSTAQQQPMEDQTTVFINGKKYLKCGLLGQGGSCQVFLVQAADRMNYALKRISLEAKDPEMVKCFLKEVDLLKRLQGKRCIIKLIDSQVFLSHGVLYMVLELGQTDFGKMLRNREETRKERCEMDLGEDQSWYRMYFKEMVWAVHTIHEERIVHKDLKPANFLLVCDQLKLIDFGIATTLSADTTHINLEEAKAGTPNYMSPEAIGYNTMADWKPGRPSDIWSLGCILYQMVYGRTPFAHLAGHRKFFSICDPNQQIEFLPCHIDHAVDVMKRCLRRNPRERITMKELLAHPFLTNRPPATAAPLPSTEPSSHATRQVLQPDCPSQQALHEPQQPPQQQHSVAPQRAVWNPNSKPAASSSKALASQAASRAAAISAQAAAPAVAATKQPSQSCTSTSQPSSAGAVHSRSNPDPQQAAALANGHGSGATAARAALLAQIESRQSTKASASTAGPSVRSITPSTTPACSNSATAATIPAHPGPATRWASTAATRAAAPPPPPPPLPPGKLSAPKSSAATSTRKSQPPPAKPKPSAGQTEVPSARAMLPDIAQQAAAVAAGRTVKGVQESPRKKRMPLQPILDQHIQQKRMALKPVAPKAAAGAPPARDNALEVLSQAIQKVRRSVAMHTSESDGEDD